LTSSRSRRTRLPNQGSYSTRQIARAFGLCVPSVRRLIREGKLEAVATATGKGNRWQVTRESYLAERFRRRVWGLLP
jgi:Helix-turn-helix domain